MVMNIQNSQDFSFAEQKLQNLQTTTTNIASKFCVKQIIYYESSSFVMLIQ
jgi:predicted DNA-binding protein